MVDNGILTVGSQEEPYQHKAIITLTGKRGQPDVSFSKTMNLGSKALGIFGNVSLYSFSTKVYIHTNKHTYTLRMYIRTYTLYSK